MANPKRKRAHHKRRRKATSARHRTSSGRSFKRNYKRRRKSSNPSGSHKRTRRISHVRHHRRRRSGNPFFGDVGSMAMEFVWLAGGGIGSRSLPVILASSYNTGFVGYLMNLASAFGLSFVAGKFKGPAAARMTLLGGFAFTASRIVDDFLSVQLVQFAQINPGSTPLLSGDVGYGVGLAGAFRNMAFVIPTNSLTGQPVAMAALPPAGGTGAKPSGMGRVMTRPMYR